MRVLVVAPAWVGDMVMAHCLVRTLKQTRNDSAVDMLAPSATAPLAERMDGVGQVHLFPLGHGDLRIGERRRIGRALDGRYDQAIVLPNSWKSALTPWFARIPRRTGWHGEARYGLLNDRRQLDPARYPRMIDRFMALGLPPSAPLPAPAPLPRLNSDAQAQQRLLETLELATDAPVLALCPGAEFGPAKRWPPRHYAAVARAAVHRGCRVWLMGSPRDADTCAAIFSALMNAGPMPAGAVVNLVGRTRLTDAIDLLALADAVVSNDSGLMHLACALDRPLVAVFGSTSPDFTPPLGARVRVVRQPIDCSPCFQRECPLGHLRCLQDLPPELVLNALSELGALPEGAV